MTSGPVDPLAILDLAAQAAAGLAALGPTRLSEEERSALGGGLFLGGPAFVRAVSQALDSGRFPGQDGAALRGEQAQAAAWLHLSRTLEELLALARDEHLRHQGGALVTAMSVVARLRHEARTPAAPAGLLRPGAALPRQALMLQPALTILKTRLRRRERAKRDRRRLAVQPAARPLRLRKSTAESGAALRRDLTRLLQRRPVSPEPS